MGKKINSAQAFLNLIGLGRSPGDAIQIVEKWHSTQQKLSVDNINQFSASATAKLDPGAIDAPPSGMYVSIHYAAYPLLYRHLALRSPSKSVISFIGSQSSYHQAEIAKMAKVSGFEINFIASGSSMIRKIHSAQRQQVPTVLLIDIPWSQNTSDLDHAIETFGGRFKCKRSLWKLLNLIDPGYIFATATNISDEVELNFRKPESLSACHEWLGNMLKTAPEYYERLNSFHRFFDFDIEIKAAACINIDEQLYLIYGLNRKAWKLPNHLLDRSLGTDLLKTPTGTILPTDCAHYLSEALNVDIRAVAYI